MVQKKRLSFKYVRVFILDEFFGLPQNHPGSFYSFLSRRFFNQVDLNPKNIFSPQVRHYEKKIESIGGIDLQILGIGRNGHIGFNEPGSSFSSVTRKVNLTPITRRANVYLFTSIREVPSQAMTMGIQTILSSREIFVLAFGKEKSIPVAKMVRGSVTEKNPASCLQLHKNTFVFLDSAAGKGLSL